jgi:hypothetical protein
MVLAYSIAQGEKRLVVMKMPLVTLRPCKAPTNALLKGRGHRRARPGPMTLEDLLMRKRRMSLARQAVTALQDIAVELRASRPPPAARRTGPPRPRENPGAIVDRWTPVLRDRKGGMVVLDLREQLRLQADLSALAAMAERAYPRGGSRPLDGPGRVSA